jgi:hypothetical protein
MIEGVHAKFIGKYAGMPFAKNGVRNDEPRTIRMILGSFLKNWMNIALHGWTATMLGIAVWGCLMPLSYIASEFALASSLTCKITPIQAVPPLVAMLTSVTFLIWVIVNDQRVGRSRESLLIYRLSAFCGAAIFAAGAMSLFLLVAGNPVSATATPLTETGIKMIPFAVLSGCSAVAGAASCMMYARFHRIQYLGLFILISIIGLFIVPMAVGSAFQDCVIYADSLPLYFPSWKSSVLMLLCLCLQFVLSWSSMKRKPSVFHKPLESALFLLGMTAAAVFGLSVNSAMLPFQSMCTFIDDSPGEQWNAAQQMAAAVIVVWFVLIATTICKAKMECDNLKQSDVNKSRSVRNKHGLCKRTNRHEVD